MIASIENWSKMRDMSCAQFSVYERYISNRSSLRSNCADVRPTNKNADGKVGFPSLPCLTKKSKGEQLCDDQDLTALYQP